MSGKTTHYGKKGQWFSDGEFYLLIHMTNLPVECERPAAAAVGTTIKVMWMRMSTSSTQVKKKTTAAVDNIEARMVCRNDDGFQEIEYVEKAI